jgi:hypothetical protein
MLRESRNKRHGHSKCKFYPFVPCAKITLTLNAFLFEFSPEAIVLFFVQSKEVARNEGLDPMLRRGCLIAPRDIIKNQKISLIFRPTVSPPPFSGNALARIDAYSLIAELAHDVKHLSVALHSIPDSLLNVRLGASIAIRSRFLIAGSCVV